MIFNETNLKSEINKILSVSTEDEKTLCKRIINHIDLTTLEGTDSDEKVKKLCKNAFEIENKEKGIPTVAAVCVYPIFVKTAVEALAGKDIKVASVAGAFPSGQSPINIRIEEVKFAVENGANEIDMVISRGRFINGDKDFIRKEVEAHKNECKNALLKVILETGELADYNMIYEASMISMESGSDFIKTSTGKIQPAATLEAAFVMLTAISDFYKKTGKKIGFKPAGGISDPETAIKYWQLANHICGKEWLKPSLFRYGASRLLNNLIDKIEGKTQNCDSAGY